MRLLAIDPGKAFIAYAIFRDDRLEEVGGLVADKLPKLAAKVQNRFRREDFDELVIEFPQVYGQRVQKGDPNDLLFLALSTGFVIQELHCTPKMELVSPKRWKGTVPKSLHNERILARLSEEEIAVIDATKIPLGKRHNLIDAVGIGLWKLGDRRSP